VKEEGVELDTTPADILNVAMLWALVCRNPLIIGVGIAFLISGCTRSLSQRRPSPPRAAPAPYHPQPDQLGRASWYGPGFHGRRTANGERYDQNGLTAAHRTLPLGSEVHVTNVANGKSVRVRINDRGPFVRGRVIDLSRGAAKQLGIIRRGTGQVRVHVLHRGQRKNMQASVALSRSREHPRQVKRTRQRSLLASMWPF